MRRPPAPTMASGTAEDPLATLRKRRPTGWPQPPEHPRVTIVRAKPGVMAQQVDAEILFDGRGEAAFLEIGGAWMS
jgi:hypothetical protein